MKLFLVMYAMGQISGFAGPLPYDKAECEVRAAALQADADTIIRTGRSTNGKNEVVTPDQLVLFKTMKFQCEERNVKPTLGDKEGI